MAEAAPSLFPYSERDTARAPESIEVLVNAPEILLTDAEKQEAYEYAVRLFDGPADEEGETTDLRKIDTINTLSNSQLLYLDYFSTMAGQQDAAAMGISTGFGTHAITKHLYGLAAHGDDSGKDIRRQTAIKSRSWYSKRLAENLEQPAEYDSEQPDSPTMRVNFAPEKLLQKLTLLQDFRTYYREQSAALHGQDPSPLREAKAALLKIHWAKVNSMTAALYPNVLSLAEQLIQSPETPRVHAWKDQLFAVAPLVRQLYHDQQHEHAETADNFLRRLDLVRNGAEVAGPGNRSSISSGLEALAQTIESGGAVREQPVDYVLSPEIVAKLDETVWQAEDLSNLLESMLDEWGLLSAERSDWEGVADRTGAPVDQKWQVVITEKADSLSVDGKKKVMLVPKSYGRTLTQQSPAGALPASAHELTHVLQCEYDELLAGQLPLAKVQGRRYLTTREFGGIYEERRMQAMFGRDRPTNTTYLRALQVKEAGGTQAEVVRAFLDASGVNTVAGRKLAADRILRLYRSGKHNSQPLDYIAQDLLAAR